MNDALILLLTHLTAAGVGAGLTYVLVNRYATVVDHDGHSAIEIGSPEESMEAHKDEDSRIPWIMVVVIAVAMIVIGVQVYNGQQQEEKRDKADAEYAECLRDAFQTAFTDLIDTIETNRSASTLVEQAATKRDNAVDRVLRVVLEARQTPPSADPSDFDRALMRARDAKAELRRARNEASSVRQENQYEVPEVNCTR